MIPGPGIALDARRPAHDQLAGVILRFPRRLSRWTLRLPEETSIGPVPLHTAKWSQLRKRVLSSIAVGAATESLRRAHSLAVHFSGVRFLQF